MGKGWSKKDRAFILSEEILSDFYTEKKLSVIILKVVKLAHMIEDYENLPWLEKEIIGYSYDKEGYIPSEDFELARKAGRAFFHEKQEKCFTESIDQLEVDLDTYKNRLKVTSDPNYINYVNPTTQNYVFPHQTNVLERHTITGEIDELIKRISKVKGSVYKYITNLNKSLSFGVKAQGIFENTQKKVDKLLMDICPETVGKLNKIYDDLSKKHEVDWADAIEGCRKFLRGVADSIEPPSDKKYKSIDGKERELIKEKYINRLLKIVEENADEKNINLIGSNIKYLADRLDAIKDISAARGGHEWKADRETAERTIIYTYLIIGDILSIKKKNNALPTSPKNYDL